MAAAGHQPARSGRGRPRIGAWIVAFLLLAGIAVAVVTTLGGDDDVAADTRTNVPSCDRPGNHPGRSAICPQADSFDPKPFTTSGDGYDCREFATQADAQAVLRADPADPNRLDPNRDGIACPELMSIGPTDLKPVQAIVAAFRCKRSDPRSARCPERSRDFDPSLYVQVGGDAYDCDVFASQADAQAVLRYTPSDPNKLDEDKDGIACPELPAPRDRDAVPRPAS